MAVMRKAVGWAPIPAASAELDIASTVLRMQFVPVEDRSEVLPFTGLLLGTGAFAGGKLWTEGRTAAFLCVRQRQVS